MPANAVACGSTYCARPSSCYQGECLSDVEIIRRAAGLDALPRDRELRAREANEANEWLQRRLADDAKIATAIKQVRQAIPLNPATKQSIGQLQPPATKGDVKGHTTPSTQTWSPPSAVTGFQPLTPAQKAELQKHERNVASNILAALGLNPRELVRSARERHLKGLEYAFENEEFHQAIASMLTDLGLPHHLITEKQAAIVNAIAQGVQAGHEMWKGDRLTGTAHMINTLSSLVLELVVPWGGTAAHALNIVGSWTTGYVYGFGWGV